ncbi:MAG: aldo/keto reductase [Saprospiraceae bacterium]
MEYTWLGRSDLKVSRICLGTMNFGQQNTQSEAVAQLEYALDQGINFVDTAEMYPVPANVTTQGMTESFIGEGIKKLNKRHQIILATKVTGPSLHVSHISSELGFSKSRMVDALEKSLKRLQTNYIDLYQLHWPERKTNCFGKLGYNHDQDDHWKDNINEIVQTLYDFKKEGKIRHWGISNETPFGLMRFLEEEKKEEGFLLTCIQNPYNLVNRTFEIGLAEMCIRKNIGVLAYSPLAFGLLTGKYHLNQSTPSDRLNQFKQMARYNGNQTYIAVQKYLDIAIKFNISLSQMSLSYLLTKPFIATVIIGATNLDQLKENIGAVDISLSKEIQQEIDIVHHEVSNPAP